LSLCMNHHSRINLIILTSTKIKIVVFPSYKILQCSCKYVMVISIWIIVIISFMGIQFCKDIKCNWNHMRVVTLLLLKVDVPCTLWFFTYWSIKKHFTSIVGSKGNMIYNHQFLQLRNNGFRVKGLATANPSKMSLS
jgi:hypothetical protein